MIAKTAEDKSKLGGQLFDAQMSNFPRTSEALLEKRGESTLRAGN